MKQQKKPRNKKKIIILTIVSLIFAFLLYIITINVSGSTRPIREVADKFHPPSDWQQTRDEVTPPRFICLNGGACPEISRTWRARKTSGQEILKIVQQTNWLYDKESAQYACGEPNQFSCSLDAHTDNFNVQLYLKKSDQLDTSEISLHIRPR